MADNNHMKIRIEAALDFLEPHALEDPRLRLICKRLLLELEALNADTPRARLKRLIALDDLYPERNT